MRVFVTGAIGRQLLPIAQTPGGEFGRFGMLEARGTSNAKARAELGWTPGYSSWRQGSLPIWRERRAAAAAPHAGAVCSGTSRLEGRTIMISARSSRGRRRPAATLVLLAIAAMVTLLALGDSAQGRGRDHTPPEFGGLASATTCYGPIGPGISSSYHLSWAAASDNVTPARRIVYEIYQTTTPGGEDLAHPTYTTPRGATSFDTPKLPVVETFYFIVRARDRSGNEDSNKVEREGVNLCY